MRTVVVFKSLAVLSAGTLHDQVLSEVKTHPSPISRKVSSAKYVLNHDL